MGASKKKRIARSRKLRVNIVIFGCPMASNSASGCAERKRGGHTGAMSWAMVATAIVFLARITILSVQARKQM